MKFTEWLTVLVPIILVAGGFMIKTYELQGRVDVIEIDRRTAGQKALRDLRVLEDRVLTIELRGECYEMPRPSGVQ